MFFHYRNGQITFFIKVIAGSINKDRTFYSVSLFKRTVAN